MPKPIPILPRAVAVSAVAATALLVAPAARAERVLLDRLEAAVNTSIILRSDVGRFKDTAGLRTQLDPLFAGTTISTQGSAAKNEEIVDFLVDERLISQQFPVTDAEVEQEVNSIQATNKIDRSKLLHALGEQGYTYEDYFELIRSSASKRNLIEREIRTKVSVSDEDVKNYFYNNLSGQKNASNRSYTLHIIRLSPSTYKSTAAMLEAAQKVIADIKGGESFEEIARRMSDDPSAPQGGEIGTFSDDELNPLFKSEVKKLNIGQSSGILGNPQTGYFVLKLADLKSGEDDRLGKMREEIRGHLMAAEYQRQVTLWIERQRQSAFVQRASLPK